MFLKVSPKFTGKKPVPEAFFNKIVGLHLITFLQQKLRRRSFFVGFARNIFLVEHLRVTASWVKN